MKWGRELCRAVGETKFIGVLLYTYMSLSTVTSPDYRSFRDSVMKRPVADKLALVKELEKEMFSIRFAELLNTLQSRAEENPISLEEITAEVEEVRARRYRSDA